jgi:DNA-binding NarL/FixJ family response regulator
MSERAELPVGAGRDGRPGRLLRVAIVEDNEVFREALGLLLGLEPDLEVVAALPDGESAVALCPELAPDVVVVDYRLGDLDGVDTTRALRVRCPGVAVLALTAAADELAARALVEAGAVECVPKDRELPGILAAIRSAACRRPGSS